jgi:hypothetical protein
MLQNPDSSASINMLKKKSSSTAGSKSVRVNKLSVASSGASGEAAATTAGSSGNNSDDGGS